LYEVVGEGVVVVDDGNHWAVLLDKSERDARRDAIARDELP
jgi:hypothetical protein